MRDWIPSPDDVGEVIRSRTTDDTGDELGTFTDTTRPTRDHILSLIDTVVERIEARCGQIPDGKQAFARRVAALGVACMVEQSYFPEQFNSDRSQYDALRADFKECYDELYMACQNDNGDSVTGDDPVLASHGFPLTPLIGHGTVW